MKKIIKFLIIIVVGLSIGGIALYNAFVNPKFWEIQIGQVLTLYVAIVVSYALVQWRNTDSHKNEKIDDLVYKIQVMISDENLMKADSDSSQQLNLMIHRSIAKKIQYVKDSNVKEIEQEVSEIESNFTILRELYSNHMKDQEYLDKSTYEINNRIKLIDDSCDSIHMKL